MAQQTGGFFDGDSFENEEQARAACAAFNAVCPPGVPRLKTIAAVGAYDAELGGGQKDSRRLTAILAYLLRSGFPIDPGFEIDVINFREERDFLKERKLADLVFVSFLIKKYEKNKTDLYTSALHQGLQDIQTQFDLSRVFGRALSPLHGEESWRRRAVHANAKMVVTYGGNYEIGTDIFCQDIEGDEAKSFVPLIPSPNESVENYSVWHGNTYDIETRIKPHLSYLYNNNAAVDVPLPWLGFCAAPGYLKAVGPALRENATYLARTALSAV